MHRSKKFGSVGTSDALRDAKVLIESGRLDKAYCCIVWMKHRILVFQSLEDLIKEEALLREKSLLSVSATRAKKRLLITSCGKPSKLLPLL